MVNLVTKYKDAEVMHDPDMYFDVFYRQLMDKIKSSDLLKQALLEIDGITEISNDSVVTKYGVASIKSIQTGSKSIVLMYVYRDKMIYDFELGINAIRFLNKQKEKYNLACTGCSWALDDSDRILIDNELVCGADNIDERIDSIYGQ